MHPYQTPVPYSKRITLLFIGVTCVSILLSLTGSANTIVGSLGAALFMGVMSAALVIDWSGVVSLRGLTDWQRIHGKKKFWLIVAWIFLFPLFFCVYLVRVAMHQFSSSSLPTPTSAPKRVRVGLVIGSLVVCLGLVSAFGSANGATTSPSSPVVSTPTDTTSISVSQGDLTQTPVIVPTDTPTPAPTATPQPKPTPKPKPHCVAVNNNPWCYNFQPGNLIYTPPAAFCAYFPCISNFWNGSGYVIECQDGMYSKSGGRSGSCSHHGGNLRPLYSH